MSPRVRGWAIGALACVLLLNAGLSFQVRAEGLGPARTGHARAIYGVATLLPTKQGLIGIGGPSLRRLAPGARRWETLHTVPGDNLYRVATDDDGRLLVGWSREPLLHVFGPYGHVTLSRPVAGTGVQNFDLSTLAFDPNGRDAIVFMTGQVRVTTGRFQGPSWSTAIHRIPLDGRTPGRLIARVDHGFLLRASAHGGVFAMVRNPGNRCDYSECAFDRIVVQQIEGDRAVPRTLFEAGDDYYSRARAVGGGGVDRVALVLTPSLGKGLELLSWRYGQARASITRPGIVDSPQSRLLAMADGSFREMRVRDGLLEVWKHDTQGATRLANLKELQPADTGLYAVGVRNDGTLWLHYGDHIGLLPPEGPPRAYSVGKLLPRRSEWTGVVHDEATDHLWLGIDGTGRHFVRVDFSDVLRRATPWPPGTLVERVHSEYAGYTAKDPSTKDKLFNATTLRTMKGGLFSIGGAALRRLRDGAQKWETLYAIPGDNLYRVAADARGLLIAAWEKDPHLHVFPPDGPRVAIPKPRQDGGDMGPFQVDELEFLPGGRDVLVVMSGQVKNPPSRHTPEPVRFYYASWATEAYRVALDGKSPPRLLFREPYGHRMHVSRSRILFALPKYPGQECEYRTCMPITAVVAYDISGPSVRKQTIITGTEMGPNRYLSQAEVVPGSDDDRVVMVLRMTEQKGKQWQAGGRSLLFWRPGQATPTVRPLPGHGGIWPVYRVTREGDFVEVNHRYDREPEILELQRFREDGTRDVVTYTAVERRPTLRGIGERAGGGLWFQWGEHVWLTAAGGAPRVYSIRNVVQRGTEYAGANAYVPTPESVWVGLDGRGRRFVRIDLETAWKKGRRVQ